MGRPTPAPPVMPSESDSGEVTRLLEALQDGGTAPENTRDELYRRVYDELHRLARHHRGCWQGSETLNATALVHEAYIKLVGGEGGYASRAHFMAVASKAMRQVLYTYAERQSAQKRGGNASPLSLDEAALVPMQRAESVLALGDALARLESVDARAAEVVECRFFGGLSVEETAEALGTSPRTVARDWAMARAWLYGELNRDLESP